jgi:hypothetical protein
MTNTKTVAGKQIQIYRSGVADWWVGIDRADIIARIVDELECEILDNGIDECKCYRAHDDHDYRWTKQTFCE